MYESVNDLFTSTLPLGVIIRLEATGGVLVGGAAPSVAVQELVPQLSPVFILFAFAYRTARSKVTSPVPIAGAVQSAVQERWPSLL